MVQLKFVLLLLLPICNIIFENFCSGLKCRIEGFGNVENARFQTGPKKIEDTCKKGNDLYCFATHCTKKNGHAQYYMCINHNNARACADNTSFWLTIRECGITERDQPPEYKKCREKWLSRETKNDIVQKYGGYECDDCMIAAKGVDNGNMDFLDSYKPTDEEKHGAETGKMDSSTKKFEIFVPIDVDDIIARAGCVSFVHSSFIVVIGFALLALVGELFCGHMLA